MYGHNSVLSFISVNVESKLDYPNFNLGIKHLKTKKSVLKYELSNLNIMVIDVTDCVTAWDCDYTRFKLGFEEYLSH